MFDFRLCIAAVIIGAHQVAAVGFFRAVAHSVSKLNPGDAVTDVANGATEVTRGALEMIFCHSVTDTTSNSIFASLCSDDSVPTTDWMGDERLTSKSLLDITLPGSHNSGNIQEFLVNDDRYYDLCDNRYYDDGGSRAYKTYYPDSDLDETQFNKYLFPWNVNHIRNITEQLNAGARFFHLKVCTVFDTVTSTSDYPYLNQTLHYHRGFTAQSFLDIAQEMKDFLNQHESEFLVLGLNNWYNQGSNSDKVKLVISELIEFFGASNIQPLSFDDMENQTLSTLRDQGKRIAIFTKYSDFCGDDVLCLDRDTYMLENWPADLGNGDRKSSETELLQDYKDYVDQTKPSYQTGRRFFVMQANPNNNERPWAGGDGNFTDWPNNLGMWGIIHGCWQNNNCDTQALYHWLTEDYNGTTDGSLQGGTSFLGSLQELMVNATSYASRHAGAYKLNSLSTDFLDYKSYQNVQAAINSNFDN